MPYDNHNYVRKELIKNDIEVLSKAIINNKWKITNIIKIS